MLQNLWRFSLLILLHKNQFLVKRTGSTCVCWSLLWQWRRKALRKEGCPKLRLVAYPRAFEYHQETGSASSWVKWEHLSFFAIFKFQMNFLIKWTLLIKTKYNYLKSLLRVWDTYSSVVEHLLKATSRLSVKLRNSIIS